MRSAGAVLEQGGAKARVGGQKSELLGDVPGGTDRAQRSVGVGKRAGRWLIKERKVLTRAQHSRNSAA